MTELQPWAMLAKGPPWMKAGVPSSVCTRFGISASCSSTVIDPTDCRSAAVTGFFSEVRPTIILARRSWRSAMSFDRQNTAMISEATEMSNLVWRGNPLAGPPSAITMSRSERSFMSTARAQEMRRASRPSLLP